MLAIELPWTDGVLRLTLPFAGSPVNLRLILTIVAGLGLIALVILLYRYEMRLIPPRFARVVLLVRILVLSLLFITLTLEPTLAHARTETIPGKVVIAIDRSASMSVSDPNRPVLEKLQLAKLLHLVPEHASQPQLDDWIRQCVVTGSPQFPAIGGESERRRYDRVMERMATITRLELAARILTSNGLGLVEGLSNQHQVEIVGFGRDISPLPMSSDRLEASLKPQANTPEAPILFTDLRLPLARASEMAGADSDASDPGHPAKLLGVILISDGRHNWGESPLTRARELGNRNIPIYPIEIAPREAPPDVAITSVQAQASTVFKGSSVPVEVTVRIAGWPAGMIPVQIELPPLSSESSPVPPLTQTIDHDGNDAIYPLTFKVRLNEPGPQVITASVDAGAVDRFPDNNRRSTRVNVVKDRAKVLIIDGEARWEFHYLHTCLGRDPNMDVRSIVFRQPRITTESDETLRRFGYPGRQLPEDLELLNSYDCIVIGDVEASQWDRLHREALEKYVAENGGTVVLVAGKRAMPLAYSLDESDPIRKLLPIRQPKVFDNPDGFPLNISPEGERSWFLSMGDTARQNRIAWERFPPHYWAIIGELKDGAELLAAVPGGPPNQRAVLAKQNYGFGRVLYLGIDSTWRWRFKIGDFYHHRFWGQVAQWAASDRLLPIINAAGTIRFGTREPIYTGGQDVEVVVRTAESVKKLGPQSLATARIIRRPDAAGGRETSAGVIRLAQPEGRPRDLSGTVAELPPGKYAVELDIPEWADQLLGPPGSDGRATPLRCPFEIMPPDQDELIELSSNRPLLQELAQASGGKLFTIATARELMDLLTAKTATRETFVESAFRQSWWLLGLIVALVSLEWIIRKWAGLP